MTPSRPLSDRAKARLRIAASLMEWRAGAAGLAELDYARVLRAIEGLHPTARERLRACVNWVEAYEREESRKRTVR